jgi:hypothetical protein
MRRDEKRDHSCASKDGGKNNERVPKVFHDLFSYSLHLDKQLMNANTYAGHSNVLGTAQPARKNGSIQRLEIQSM